MAVHQQDGKGCAGAQAARALRDVELRGNSLASGRAGDAGQGAPLSLVPERSLAGSPRRNEGVGVRLQVQHRLAQGAQGRRSGRSRRRILFRNVTELILFGIKGKNTRTLAPGRRQVNYLATRKREHSRKPDEQYAIIEACSLGRTLNYLRAGHEELFARGTRRGWATWGNQASDGYRPTWKTYAHHSQAGLIAAE